MSHVYSREQTKINAAYYMWRGGSPLIEACALYGVDPQQVIDRFREQEPWAAFAADIKVWMAIHGAKLRGFFAKPGAFLLFLFVTLLLAYMVLMMVGATQ